MKRNRKQVTCHCSAYSFPHRFGGGKCRAINIVESCFHSRSMCVNCNLFTEYGCEVLNEKEHARECPGVQEFIHFNEVKL